MFTLKINTNNDTFQNGNMEVEIRRILNRVRYEVNYYDGGIDRTKFSIYDINGNKVGSWKLT